MIPTKPTTSRKKLFQLEQPQRDRLPIIMAFFALFFVGITARTFFLQVINGPYYMALAEGQRTLVQQITPERGEVFVRDLNTGEEYPIAANQDLEFVYGVPRDIDDVDDTLEKLKEPLELSEDEIEDLKERLADKEDLYEPVKRQVEPKVWQEIQALELPGIAANSETWRYYPEGSLASQAIGFVGFVGDDQVGQYGIEEYYDDLLIGKGGSIEGETDSVGRRIVSAGSKVVQAEDGADILLTLDRTVQHLAQTAIEDGVKKYQADHGEIIVMNPQTGEILAMAKSPGFDPNKYGEVKDLAAFKNTAINDSYEPGSTFKPLIAAAAIDKGLIDENTTFVDNGCRTVSVHKICNYDLAGPGILTTTGALEKSSNVVMSQISEKLGRSNLFKYLVAFGFNALTGITLEKEGDIGLSDPENWPDSQVATIGFGQGIAITPLHLITAVASLANDGKLMQPHIVKEIRHPDGEVENFEPKVVSEPVKASTALTVTAMLVSAIENGVAEPARLDEYIMAGKTGTAQVANSETKTYDGSRWVSSFIGYGPIEDPAVIVLVRYFDPKTSIYGANTAAPTFAEVAPKILHHLRIPGDRRD